MFNAISWGDYLTTILFLLTVYYAVIAYRFYKEEILSVIGIKVVQPAKFSTTEFEDLKQSFKSNRDEDYMPKPEPDVDLTPVILSFKDETSAFLQEAAANKIIKPEILFALETIAHKYAVLNNADCKAGIISELHEEANTLMPGAFSIDDFKTLFSSK
jgi:hypothetical protein